MTQGDDGVPVEEICRKAGISQVTYFNWRRKYAGLLPDEMRRLKALKDVNSRQKMIVADLTLDRETLQDVIRRNVWSALSFVGLHKYQIRPMIMSAQRSPSIMAGALVLPALMSGTADMSQTLSPLTPRTRIRASRTASGSPSGPMRAVPAG